MKPWMNLASKFLINGSLYLFDFLTFLVKLGCPQGLLLAKQSAFAMFIRKTTQQTFVVCRWFIALAIAENLVHDLWILLCRSISFTGQAYEQRGRENRACFTSLDIKGLSFFTGPALKRQVT
jgi:hypothetical protein